MEITVQQVELLSDDDYIYLDVRGEIAYQHGTMLGCEFFRCVRFKILRFHGETAQGLTGGLDRKSVV